MDLTHNLTAQDADDIALQIIPLTIEVRPASTPTWRHVNSRARRAELTAHTQTRGIHAFQENAEPTKCFLEELDLEICDLGYLQSPRSRLRDRLRARREQMHQTPSRSHRCLLLRLLHQRRTDPEQPEHVRRREERLLRRLRLRCDLASGDSPQ